MSNFNEASEKIAEGITEGCGKIEEGESVEEAKARMEQAQKAREEKRTHDAEKREVEQKVRMEAILESSRNAGKRN